MKQADVSQINLFEVFGRVTSAAKYLLSKWFIIGVTVVVCGALGVLYAWLQKPVYIAEMRFVTEEDEGSGLGMYAGIAAQFGVDLGSSGSGGAFEGENLIELLKSRTLVERTLLTPSSATPNAPLMIDLYIANKGMKKAWQNNPALSHLTFTPFKVAEDRVRDSILGKIYQGMVKGDLDISKKDKKLNIISIVLKDENEFFAKTFVELLASNAIKFYTDYKSTKSRQNVDILQRQTDSVKRMLFGNITEVAAINDLNVNPIRQTVRAGSQRKQVDVQANAALYGELVKNLELSKIALRKETPLIQVIDAPKFPLEKKKLGRLLTGIIFAFVGGILVTGILLVRRVVRQQRSKVPSSASFT